ncbi:hypothetical protein [Desulfosporosinus sp. SB140]|uniref:hypothetical protein n=1 Tax=Desulfosporosinus paludis TaxID=3115649 RepID=UPI00388F38E3
MRFFRIILISNAFVGKVNTASAGMDTVTSAVVGLVWITCRGVHVGRVAVLGKIGLGVTG